MISVETSIVDSIFTYKMYISLRKIALLSTNNIVFVLIINHNYLFKIYFYYVLRSAVLHKIMYIAIRKPCKNV